MENVKRYELEDGEMVEENFCGNWIKFQDYIKLKEKYDAPLQFSDECLRITEREEEK